MTDYGYVTSVWMEELSTTLTADAAPGATSLAVLTTGGFTLGSVSLGGHVLRVTAMDDTTLTLDPATPVPADGPYEASFPVYNVVAGQIEQERRCDLSFNSGGNVDALVPTTVEGYLPVGDYEDPLQVEAEVVDGEYRIVRLVGQPATLDGSILDPTTIPEYVPTTPPASSPALTVTGAPNSLVVVAEKVDPSTLIEYHISTVDGFTPDPTTLIGEPTRSTVLVVTHLPDGSQLQADVTYYLLAIATNAAGDAAPSPQVTGKLDTAAVSSLIAAQLTAGFVLAGQITVGNITITPDGGIVIPQPNGGTITFPADGSNAIVTAHLVATYLTTNGPAEFQDAVTLSDVLTMNATVQPPKTAVTLTDSSRSLSIGSLPGDGGQANGLTENSDTPGSGTAWVTAAGAMGNGTTGSFWICEVDKVSGVVTSHPVTGITDGSTYIQGVVRIAGRYYLLMQDGSTAAYHVWSVDPATWAATHAFDYTGSEWAYGTDGSNLIFAYTRSSDNKPVFRTFTTAGVQVGSNVIGDTALVGSNVEQVTKVTADFGAPCFVVGCDQTGGRAQIMIYDGTTGALQPASKGWVPYASPVQGGIYYDGTRFHQIPTTGKLIYHHAKHSADQTVTATSSVTDGAAETPAGTVLSTSTLWRRFHWLKAETPPPPSTPAGLFANLYVGTSSTRRLQTPSPALSPANRVGYLDDLATTTATAPTAQAGAFSAGGLGEILAASGGFSIDGNSNGSVGTGTFLQSIITALKHPEWAVRAKRATDTLTLPASQNNVVNWDSKTDPGGVLATSAFTVPAAAPAGAIWRLTVNIWWANDGTGRRTAAINLNDTAGNNTQAQDSRNAVTGGVTRQTVIFEDALNPGDVLRVFTFHTSTAAGGLAIMTGSWAALEYVRAA